MRRTGRFIEAYPDAILVEKAVFGIAKIEHKNDELEKLKRGIELEIRTKFADLEDPRIKAYEGFYRKLGLEQSHMKSQIRGIARGKQLPQINTLVDSVFVPELRHCVLMGGHDRAKIDGDVTVDITAEGEEFTGIGGRKLAIPADDIVLRDSEEIIASLTMGPCDKTKLGLQTKEMIVYAFLV
jgi:DNA/RNA-binding domain of Phe-tRNA-synthetase-like protein